MPLGSVVWLDRNLLHSRDNSHRLGACEAGTHHGLRLVIDELANDGTSSGLIASFVLCFLDGLVERDEGRDCINSQSGTFERSNLACSSLIVAALCETLPFGVCNKIGRRFALIEFLLFKGRIAVRPSDELVCAQHQS